MAPATAAYDLSEFSCCVIHDAVGHGERVEMVNLDTAADGVLMVAIGRWQEPALAEVYRRHGGAVHTLAQRVTGSSSLADEVTQEVFLDIWKRPDQFDAGRGTLRTLLLTKTHGRAVDLVRSEVARKTREERSAMETALGGYDLDRYAWDLAIADQVRVAVGTLPDEERKLIEMAYFDGRTYREVASVLGEPEGTVKSRIRSGLRRLRTALIQQGVETPWTAS
ncbi:MAG: RNA polymerase sigma factor [Acidimicrobiales bacterium]